ncbi:prolyl oligopeptidase family serine peptidase [Dyella sp. ASV21]|uniref:carboxylesterase family protein n=1 Tax=Dyella sp. ASV21 TaxID=2795114 RepID=UPI0018EDF583|nr:prolyl oligopeptidase family serine peptidase [Dyella sp. ASV21]
MSLGMGMSAHAGEARFEARAVTVDGHVFPYQVFVPRDWSPERAWPVVLFLHGSGERGRDNQAQLSQGLPPWLKQHGEDFPAVVVAPQAPDDTIWDGAPERAALAALEASIQTYHGDRERLYLTGLSMGGYGAWQLAVDHPRLFAAAVVICGGVRAPSDMRELAVHGVPAGGDPYAWVASRVAPMPVWIFHGAADDVVSPEDSRAMYAALRTTHSDVRFTLFPGVNHGSWVPAYASPALWPWVFSHRLARSE